jgi:CheY-like chemotaxis protein
LSAPHASKAASIEGAAIATSKKSSGVSKFFGFFAMRSARSTRPSYMLRPEVCDRNRQEFRPFDIYKFPYEEPPVRILVVEDDALIREFVVEALREEGYEVIHAANGEEALTWCGRRVADVLITDVKLPGSVDGWQIAEGCREQDPEFPVIYATGFSPVAPRPVSGSVLLQKPYQPEAIVRAVRQVTKEGPVSKSR